MRHFGTQYYDKKIKRYFNKKIFLSHGISIIITFIIVTIIFLFEYFNHLN